MPIFTEEDPTYDDLSDLNSLASGSVNEILDGIADVQDFRDSVLLEHLDDLTIPDHQSEEGGTIKKKPFANYLLSKLRQKDSEDQGSNMSLTESDFINQAFASGSGGKISRSNSSNQLTKSSSSDFKVKYNFSMICSAVSQLL